MFLSYNKKNSVKPWTPLSIVVGCPSGHRPLFHLYILEESICYLRGIRCIFLGLFSSRQKLMLTNCGDPNQTLHYVASDLGLHCLPMYPI